jgi:hypothetical protein
LHLSITGAGGTYRWRLTRRTPRGADVLAQGLHSYPDEASCHRAAARLAHVPAEGMLAVQRPDGHWFWQITGDDGWPLARSPATFRDAASCGRALAYLRHELTTLSPG